jgi:asparagine synthase (glutamine-hydrolysing)
VDLTGLDQVLSFPGLVSPRSMFKGIKSLAGGQYISVRDGGFEVKEYWDLDYPRLDELPYDHTERYYIDCLGELLSKSVEYRLQADVQVGFYLSGGLDSSLIGALIHQISPDIKRHSFSIEFRTKDICESRYQKMLAKHISSVHHELIFDWEQIAERLTSMIYHCECPVKETSRTTGSNGEVILILKWSNNSKGDIHKRGSSSIFRSRAIC